MSTLVPSSSRSQSIKYIIRPLTSTSFPHTITGKKKDKFYSHNLPRDIIMVYRRSIGKKLVSVTHSLYQSHLVFYKYTQSIQSRHVGIMLCRNELFANGFESFNKLNVRHDSLLSLRLLHSGPTFTTPYIHCLAIPLRSLCYLC